MLTWREFSIPSDQHALVIIFVKQEQLKKRFNSCMRANLGCSYRYAENEHTIRHLSVDFVKNFQQQYKYLWFQIQPFKSYSPLCYSLLRLTINMPVTKFERQHRLLQMSPCGRVKTGITLSQAQWQPICSADKCDLSIDKRSCVH